MVVWCNLYFPKREGVHISSKPRWSFNVSIKANVTSIVHKWLFKNLRHYGQKTYWSALVYFSHYSTVRIDTYDDFVLNIVGCCILMLVQIFSTILEALAVNVRPGSYKYI
jgi:hypothetical protein